MDDVQFNASLDALLANETLDTGQTTTSNNASSSTLSYPSSQQQQEQQYCSGDNNATAMSAQYSHSLNSGASTNVSSAGLSYNTQNPSAAIADYGRNPMDGGNGVAPNPMVPLAPGSASLSTGGALFAPGHFFVQHNRRGGSVASSTSERTRMSGTKRSRGGVEVSEDEEERDRRRHDRNMREQQRSQKITHQIDDLRSILTSAQIRHKPDKFSTLVTVGEYIKQLQQRSAMLDAEHKKLIDTISKTNELANEPHLNSGNAGVGADMAESTSSGLSTNASSDNPFYNEDEKAFVQNVDYKSIFVRCGIALAVASVDGRFLDCNREFEKMTGYKREELLPVETVPKSGSVAASSEGISSLSSSSLPPPPLTSSYALEDTMGTAGEAQENNGNIAVQKYNPIDGNASTPRNLSLFNLLSRDCMEGVFVALSGILKHSSNEGEKDDDTEKKDYWCGNVRLNRNSDIEVSTPTKLEPA
jgi:PAS domain-containing protein